MTSKKPYIYLSDPGTVNSHICLKKYSALKFLLASENIIFFIRIAM